jgi:hypothetical protein
VHPEMDADEPPWLHLVRIRLTAETLATGRGDARTGDAWWSGVGGRRRTRRDGGGCEEACMRGGGRRWRESGARAADG